MDRSSRVSVDAPTTQPSSGMPSTADPTRPGQNVRATDKPSSPLLTHNHPGDLQSFHTAEDRESASPVPVLREVMPPSMSPCGVPISSSSDTSSSETPSPVLPTQTEWPRYTTASAVAPARPSHQNGVLPIPAPIIPGQQQLSPSKRDTVRPLPVLTDGTELAAQLANRFEPADRQAIANIFNRGVSAAAAAAGDRASGGSGTRMRITKVPIDPEAHKFGKDGGERMVWEKDAPVRSRSLRGKDKLGFASLPPHLLRYIFTIALDDVAVPPVLDRVWPGRPTWFMVFMLLQRRWLATMRSVCIPWMHAANAHPFWLKWVFWFAPARRPDDIQQLYGAADRLSVPLPAHDPLHGIKSRPQTLQEIYTQPRLSWTNFAIARAHARGVCIPCRVNRPNCPALPTAHRDGVTWTPALGVLGACWGHADAWCHHCLRDDQLLVLDELGRKSRMMRPPGVEDLDVYPSRKGDTDDEGRGRRVESEICADCRLESLQWQLRNVVEQSAAGWPLRAQERLFELPATTTAGRSYVTWGRGIARVMATRAVEEKWLSQQARWTEMYEMAVDVQKIEETMRESMRRHGELGVHGLKLKHKRSALLLEMHGDEDGLEDNDWMLYQWELSENLRRWRLEWNGLAEDEEYDIDDEDFEAHELGERWWYRTRQTTILDWIRDRIKHGFWVSPTDEILQLNSPASPDTLHTPIETIAHTATHAFPNDAESDPRLIYAQRIGYVKMDDTEADADDDGPRFAPPTQLLLDLDALFADKLTAGLGRPFIEIVKGIMFDFGGDVEKTWNRCRDMDGAELLLRLKEQLTWFEGGIVWSQKRLLASADALVKISEDELGDGELTDGELLDDEFEEKGEEGEMFEERTSGPRIEMVQVEQHLDEDNVFGITEVSPSSSVESDHGQNEDEHGRDGVSVSKRSRLASHRSETAMADSEGADVVDYEMETTTTTTTSLGKRKEAPEGDGLLDQRAGKERKSESPKASKSQSPTLVSPEMPSLGVMSESETRGTSETSSVAVPKTPDDFADDIANDTVTQVQSGNARKEPVKFEPPRQAKDTASKPDLTPRGFSSMPLTGIMPESDDPGSDDERDEDEFDEEDEEDDDSTPPPAERDHTTLPQVPPRLSVSSGQTSSIRVKLGNTVTAIPRGGAPRSSVSEVPSMYLEPCHVPWVPANFEDLGPGAQGVIMKAWEETWKRVASCRCGICVRGEAIQIALTE